MPEDRGLDTRNKQMKRQTGYENLTMEANGFSEAFDMRPFVTMTVHMPTTTQGWTAASIGFYVSPTIGGTYQPAYDDAAGAVQIVGPAVDGSYVAPPEVAAFRFVKLWSHNGQGGTTAQAVARPITIDLKA